MANTQGVQAVVTLKGLTLDSEMMRMTSECGLRMDLPSVFTREHIARMENDFALISELAGKHPEAIVEIHNAVLRNDFDAAAAGARKIGLTEDALVDRGGGSMGVAAGFLLVVAVVVIAGSLSGDSPEPEVVGPGDSSGRRGTPITDGGLPPGGTGGS